MSTVDKNPVVKTRSGEVRSSEASGVVDAFEMKAKVNEILNRRPAVGLAVGVVRNGSLEFFYGHGLANIESNTPITEDTVFRIASITKTFTAIAVMQLWEQGLIDLDAPANDYLRAYKLIPAKAAHRPATLRHLMTPHRRRRRGRAPLRRVPAAGVRREREAGTAGAVAGRVLPAGSAHRGRAGHQVHLQQPRPGHRGSDRRGRERAAPGPLPPRERL